MNTSQILYKVELKALTGNILPGAGCFAGKAYQHGGRGIEVIRGGRMYSLRGVTVPDISNFRLMMRLLQRNGKAEEPFY